VCNIDFKLFVLAYTTMRTYVTFAFMLTSFEIVLFGWQARPRSYIFC